MSAAILFQMIKGETAADILDEQAVLSRKAFEE
jgi:hypothetical protein